MSPPRLPPPAVPPLLQPLPLRLLRLPPRLLLLSSFNESYIIIGKCRGHKYSEERHVKSQTRAQSFSHPPTNTHTQHTLHTQHTCYIHTTHTQHITHTCAQHISNTCYIHTTHTRHMHTTPSTHTACIQHIPNTHMQCPIYMLHAYNTHPTHIQYPTQYT